MTQLSAHEKTRQYWEEHTVAHILPHVLGEFDEKNVEEVGVIAPSQTTPS